MPLTSNGLSTIGRESQLEQFEQLVRNISNRQSAGVFISGESGIGKTHLLGELAARARQQSVRVITLRCIQSDSSSPFSLFLRLGAILEVEPPVHLESDVERFRYGRTLLDEVSSMPTIISIDDVQWCDYPSIATLVHLFDYAMTIGIGIAVASRLLDEIEDVGLVANVRLLSRLMTRIDIEGLNKSEITQLIERELTVQVRGLSEEQLMNLTSGNPFFLLELVRGINSDPVKALVNVPREVVAILDQRITQLKENEDIIAMAAVIGINGERRMLSAALQRLNFDDSIVTNVLHRAEESKLLTLTNNTYEFRHSLYMQRLINRLSLLKRDSFHEAIALVLAQEGRFRVAVSHMVSAGTSFDAAAGLPVAQKALEYSLHTGDHVGVIDAGTWLLEYGDIDNSSRLQILLCISHSQVAVGRRTEGRTNAQNAVALARKEKDHESEAAAVMQWAARSDFMPERSPILEAFEKISIDSLCPDTRVKVLSAHAQAVTMVPTDEYVSIESGSRLVSQFGTSRHDGADPAGSSAVAWNWSVRADTARYLAQQAMDEVESAHSSKISVSAHVQSLLAWRETHRSPEFLRERLKVTTQALALIDESVPQYDSVRFCHILDLLESGEYAQADIELVHFLQTSRAGGNFIAKWWSEFLHAGRLISRGRLAEARDAAASAFERGETADEPGRLIVYLEQQTMILLETVIPPELSQVFAGDTAVLANHYARATAALANAALGNVEVAERYVRDSVSVLDDHDKEAAWLPTVTIMAETAHLLGLTDIAGRCVQALEPFHGHHVTFIGNTVRGPVRRYLGLARHAAGDTRGAVDDILMARNDARLSGEHMWALACSVDLLEMLASVDPERALHLTPPSVIAEAQQSEMTWRARRGAIALDRARSELAQRLGLTHRQVLVLRGLLQESTIKEIAVSLGFSHSTVRQESIAIYKALGVSGRGQVMSRARDLMLV
jgi:DNA-binding CsgD family transcriptional regulator